MPLEILILIHLQVLYLWGTANSGIAVNIGHSTSEVTIGDNLSVTGSGTITGDLDVNGTLTTIDTTNLRVLKDRFILVVRQVVMVV